MTLDGLWERTLALVDAHGPLIKGLAETLVRERLIAGRRLETILDGSGEHTNEGATPPAAADP